MVIQICTIPPTHQIFLLFVVMMEQIKKLVDKQIYVAPHTVIAGNVLNQSLQFLR